MGNNFDPKELELDFDFDVQEIEQIISPAILGDINNDPFNLDDGVERRPTPRNCETQSPPCAM